MPVIGTFKADKDGYAGTIRTLSINAKVRIVANDHKQSSSAPDFRVFAGAAEVGAAWRKKSVEDQSSYLRMRLDDPAFGEPIRCALIEKADDGILLLLWRREKTNDSQSA
jgi:uncharacterized protein (DUF736 family)